MRLFGRTHSLFQNLARKRIVRRIIASNTSKVFSTLFDVIFRQRARISSRIRQHFVPFVKRLRESRACFSLINPNARSPPVADLSRSKSNGDIDVRRFAFFDDNARFAQTFISDCLGNFTMPQTRGGTMFFFKCAMLHGKPFRSIRNFQTQPRHQAVRAFHFGFIFLKFFVEPAALIFTRLCSECSLQFPKNFARQIF